jgi:hypothetical protein
LCASRREEMPRMVLAERACQSFAVRLAAHNTTLMVRSNGVRRLRDRPRWPAQPSDALRSH